MKMVVSLLVVALMAMAVNAEAKTPPKPAPSPPPKSVKVTNIKSVVKPVVATVTSVATKAKVTVGDSVYSHVTRPNGDRSLVYGTKGSDVHNHAVIDSKGNVKYLREEGQVIAEDSELATEVLMTIAFITLMCL
ncbi:MAG: hypothetical protein NTY04_01150 [Candidatus Staskawiczbacteria bacterium]|nr:hypothetical protein [Candidatus Staskawiczbacteria bacterium]